MHFALRTSHLALRFLDSAFHSRKQRLFGTPKRSQAPMFVEEPVFAAQMNTEQPATRPASDQLAHFPIRSSITREILMRD
jgi:hypothetical protein